MNDLSISVHFSEDHDRLDELFRRFQTRMPSDRARAVQSFEEFKQGLERHIVWEEGILFPAFELKTGHTEGPTTVMRMEHQEIRGLLGAISARLTEGRDDTVADEAALLAVLAAHNHKEENILYPMIDQVTGAEERTEMFAEMHRQT